MRACVLDQIARIVPPGPWAERLGMVGSSLELRRAWPRSGGHLLLEYADAQSRTVAGQWRADVQDLDRSLDRTMAACPDSACLIVPPAGVEGGKGGVGGVMLQPGGADRVLGALHRLASDRHSTLIVHRPERRGVVRTRSSGTVVYAKVVRSERLGGVCQRARSVEGRRDLGFQTPRVLHVDQSAGSITFEELGGPSLHESLGASLASRVMPDVGRALRRLHGAPMDDGSAVHDAAAEVALLERSVRLIDELGWSGASEARARCESACDRLAAGAIGHAPLHRDFYDKQVIIHPAGGLGLLDFDTMAVGEPALDVANMLAHLELRHLQGLLDRSSLAAAVEGFVAGYAPGADLLERLGAYLDSTRVRLACVYALRPRWSAMAASLPAQDLVESIMGLSR